MLTQEDIKDMRICGKAGKSLYPFHKVWFSLKDQLLKKYGFEDGYDLQIWYDEEYRYWGEDTKDIVAEHCHILKRYIVDEKYVFHMPTNEFSYFDFISQFEKSSSKYSKYAKLCRNKIEGKRPHSSLEEEKEGWKSLKRLVRKYGYLVRYPYLATIQKQLA